ncbi:MAG: hypothetical protein AVDCRST_MAG03-2534 [uncultured Rubrobacteraceae bacterium]|uniref:Polymerase nucleotidyl transferase domain-containing protein n=1 Tax=uncultured Rubrobacteraceae bacterium TaxID=349277 RepID=A0A6J4PS92_9ACTN|nr:MAG: hypothetical protein AVDCRST_MAG03-2534 [uncultured Rubrobacteraceae bacterium]
MVTTERADEVSVLLAMIREWAERRPDVVAVGLVGSWAHGDARMDSDVDVALVTEDRKPYLEDHAWVRELGGVRIVRTRRWGPMTERRFVMPSGLEVEVGVGLPSWLDPADEGVRRTVKDGMWVVYDPRGILAALLDACSLRESS